MSFLWGCSYQQRKIGVGFSTQNNGTTGSSIVDDGTGKYVLQFDYTSKVPRPSRVMHLETVSSPDINDYIWCSHYVKCTSAPVSPRVAVFGMWGDYSSLGSPVLYIDSALTTISMGVFSSASYKVSNPPAGTGTSSGTISALSTARWIATRWKTADQHFEVWVDDSKIIDFVFDGSDSGTSTATGAATMTDSGATWTTDEWIGYRVVSGGSAMTIMSNTGTVITGAANWGGGDPGTGAYTLSDPGTISQAVDMDLFTMDVFAGFLTTTTIQFSDSILNDEDGDGITGRPAKDDYVYDLLVPDGDKIVTQMEDEGGGTTDIYQSVDEIPVDGADYIVRTGTSVYRAEFQDASPGGGKQVRAVVAYADHDGNDASPASFQAQLGSGSTLVGPDMDGATGGDAYVVTTTPGQWNLATFDGAEWTTALYDTLNLGVVSSQSAGVHYDGFALDVLYGPETAVAVIPNRIYQVEQSVKRSNFF